MTSRTRTRAITLATIALVGVLGLAGCSGGDASPTGTSSGGTGATSGGTGTGGGSSAGHGPSATPRPVGTRVHVPCDTLVPAAALAVYGRSLTLQPDATPPRASTAATIAAQRGEVCTWAAGDVRVTVAVASLPEANLTRLEDSLFEDSHSVPTYTVEGYFTTVHGVGRGDAFVDPYWINAESTMFGEPGDVQPVMDAARAALATSAPAPSATAQAG